MQLQRELQLVAPALDSISLWLAVWEVRPVPADLCYGLNVDIGLCQCAHHGGSHALALHHALAHSGQHAAVVNALHGTHTAAAATRQDKTTVKPISTSNITQPSTSKV